MGKISEEEALRNADSPNNVRLKIKFAKEHGGSPPARGPISTPAQPAPAQQAPETPAAPAPSPAATLGSDLSLELVEEEEEDDRIF